LLKVIGANRSEFVWSAVEKWLDKPFEVLTLVGGLVLALLGTVSIKTDGVDLNQSPSYALFVLGACLAIVSILLFLAKDARRQASKASGSGVDLTLVKEDDGGYWTKIADCEVRVVYGKIQDFRGQDGLAVILPCNEYFDDACVRDPRSTLGAYAQAVFADEIAAFESLMKAEAMRILGPGSSQMKNDKEHAVSFGVGRCFLLDKPLGYGGTIALVSTTTQRPDEGLAGKISYVFTAMSSVVRALANAGRYSTIITPVLGSGHGRINAATAFVGMLLAIAEAIESQGGRRIRKVTVVVFKKDENAQPEVDPIVIKRALALIGQQSGPEGATQGASIGQL
jgi:hypothetical protein